MPPNFEWEFIEEDSGALRRIDGGKPAPKSWRRWLLCGTVAAVLLLLTGLLVRAWVVGRLKAADRSEAELRAAVELELRTIAESDVELFRARQDPADAEWQRSQVTRYVSPRAAQFAPAPGLAPTNRPAEIQEIRLSGRTGRVKVVRWFEAVPPEAVFGSTPSTGSLPFHVVWFYRQDDEGIWYHVAPPDDYRGTPHSWHGTWLVIRASRVEAELIDPIAADLAFQVARFCRLLDCPADAGYTLSFEETALPQLRGDHWAVPALYLAGLPEDETARAAWQQAVEAALVELLAQTQVGRQDLVDRVVYRQLVKRLRAELGLGELAAPDVELLTEAVRDRDQHALEELWEATTDAIDPEEVRLIEAEVDALLGFLEERVGARRLFQLLPALGDYPRLGNALAALYRIDSRYFETNWSVYLSGLAGVPAGGARSTAGGGSLSDQPMPAPAAPVPPSVPPGDDIALVCDGRIWVGNGDGSQMVPLTSSGERFNYLHWSPDGRWLLTTWQPNVTGVPGVLYVLAVDGSGGRILPDPPAASVLPLGWSPDGQDAVYAVWRNVATFPLEIRAVDVETGEVQGLPGVPDWSPDGEHLTYVPESFGRAWLAGGDWEDARPIADRAWAAWQGGSWAPDSSKLALQLDEAGRAQRFLAVFDLKTERLTIITTSRDFTEALLSFQGKFITDGADPASLKEEPLRWLWPFGWSADGSRILVWAHRNDRGSATRDLSALAVVPLDGSAPQVLAYISGSFLSKAAWSPTNPERLAFTWLPQADRNQEPTTFLVDLKEGPLYAGTGGRDAVWSPDGTAVALMGQGGVVIIDEEGQERVTLKPEGTDGCSSVAWNPAADLSRSPTTATFVPSAEALWHKVRDER
jgi:hypothetical protein